MLLCVEVVFIFDAKCLLCLMLMSCTFGAPDVQEPDLRPRDPIKNHEIRSETVGRLKTLDQIRDHGTSSKTMGPDLRPQKKMLGAYSMKRVAAGAHLPTPWLFEPEKRPDDRADY